MAAPGSPHISLATLEPFHGRDEAREQALGAELQARGLLEPVLAFVSQGLPPNPYSQQRLAFLQHVYETNASPGGFSTAADLHKAFHQAKLTHFIESADSAAHEREMCLDALRAQDGEHIPPDIRLRIYELCFIPHVVFEWSEEIYTRMQHAYSAGQKKQKDLRLQANRLQAEPCWSEVLKAQQREEFQVVSAFLVLTYPHPKTLRPWLKEILHLDKDLHGHPEKHRLWTFLFKDLVDTLRPFCAQGSRKQNYLQDVPTSRKPRISDDTYVVASRLMALACPQYWTDNPKRVQERYADAWRHMRRHKPPGE